METPGNLLRARTGPLMLGDMNAETPTSLHVHPDRLFPADPALRETTRAIYDSTKDLPIISPHSHVPAEWLALNEPFSDPTSLLLVPDHYVLRLLHANGIDLSELGRGPDGPLELTEEQARHAWRLLCENYYLFRGTVVKYWFDTTFADVFGIDVAPSAQTADAIYDKINDALKAEEFRPRALMERFGISVLATTDDPVDDLRYHQMLAEDPTFTARVIPTFRPDRYYELARADWPELAAALGEAAGVDTGTYAGFLEALRNRRQYFKEHGAVSSDHSHFDAAAAKLTDEEAEAIYASALDGVVSKDEADRFRRNLIMETAKMATEDGLVMTIHPAVVRSHDPVSMDEYGADVGSDIPVNVEFTKALQPLLARYGNHPNFNLVVFTLDETTFSRELAPLAGYYRALYVGAPWWFIDSPEAIRRYRASVTDIAGFYRTSGFIDDTRAFLSIPTRHDMARRLDAGYLAGLVSQELLTLDEAIDTARDIVVSQPTKVFKL